MPRGRTQRSVRDFTDEPVPDELVDRMLEAARWAPNAANRQLWEFVVVRDAALKNEIGAIYKRSMTLLQESLPVNKVQPDPRTQAGSMLAASMQLVESIGTVPVLILVGYGRAGMPYSTDMIFK